MYDVRRVLGISRGGDAALMAVAHLAGGDYDMGGADNVGEALALGAVRQLLAGCQVCRGGGGSACINMREAVAADRKLVGWLLGRDVRGPQVMHPF
jgi:hypothetical protein